jgi:hypothetical protein
LGSIINTIATKDDLANFKSEISKEISNFLKWVIIAGISQIAATLAIAMLILKS